MTTWENVALVVRSQCHDRTWIGHVQWATLEDTPAGPLRIVKAECVEMVRQHWTETERAHRWRQGDADTWMLDVEVR